MVLVGLKFMVERVNLLIQVGEVVDTGKVDFSNGEPIE